MNFRNNFYPNNNVHGVPFPMTHNQMQRNINPDMGNQSMQCNMNPYYKGGMHQLVAPSNYNNYNRGMQMQGNPQFAYEGNCRTPFYPVNRDNQYNNYDNSRYNNRNRIQQRENFKEYYDRATAPVREARRNFANNSSYNAVDDEFYNYNSYSRPMVRNEDSKSSFRNNFFTRLSSNNKGRRTSSNESYRSNYRDEENSRRLSRRCKPTYEDEYDDYEDEKEECREERHPRRLSRRCKPTYEDEYDDYEDDDRLVERKHRFMSGPINFFKKKKKG